MKSVYLQHPSDKVVNSLQKKAKSNSKYKFSKPMCGLCGGHHYPGEPHKTKDLEKHFIKPLKLAPINRGPLGMNHFV